MLQQRIVTALVLVAILLPALFYLPPYGHAILFALICSAAAWEWVGLLQGGRFARWGCPLTLLAACALLYQSELAQSLVICVAILFWLGIAPVCLVRSWTAFKGTIGYLLGIVLLLAAWSAVLFLLRLGVKWGGGPFLLLACMSLVWIADIAAYLFGRLFGRHKLAPSISPGKTWEGVAGAMLGVMLAGLALFESLHRAIPVRYAAYISCLILLTAVSIVGDLFESLLKRKAGVKDSSQLLPGHGGVLDRIDSLISTLPVAAFLLAWGLA